MASPRFFSHALATGLLLTAALLRADPGVLQDTRFQPSPLLQALPESQIPELKRFIELGLAHGPGVLIRQWELEQSRQNIRAARAAMLPQASGYVSAGQIKEERVNEGALVPIPDRNVEALLYNAGVSQAIFHWGALKKNYQVNKLHAAISARNHDETRRLLAVDLRRRYFDYVLAHGSVVLQEKSIQNQETELARAKKRVADGFAPSTESGIIDYALIQARITLQRLVNDRDTLRRNLARVAGLPLEQLPEPVAELPKAADLDALIKALSPDQFWEASVRFQNMEDYVRVERLNYEINSTRLRPKLGFSFNVGQDDRNPDNNILGPKSLITTWTTMATVNWTLFDGLATSAAKRANLARMRAYEIDRDQIARQDADERRQDVARLQLIWRQLQEAEKNFTGARSAVAVLEKDVAAGWIANAEVEVARAAADAALQSINTSRAEFYTALANYFSNRGFDPVLFPGRR